MERKIGEIFEYKGEWYQCIRNLTCTNCGFNNKGCLANRHITGDCSGRLDGASVIFKKLEKIGEPYKLGEVLIQQYQGIALVVLPKDSECSSIFRVISSINVIEIEIKQNKENMEEYKMHDAKEDIPEFDKVVDECLFGEDKLNLKPFDLEAAKAGKPVCTRDGRKARIICFDAKGTFPIIALVDENAEEFPFSYTADGKYAAETAISNKDLMMLPDTKEGWVNVYKNQIHNTPESAEEGHKGITDYIKTIRVEWEE